jgi:hypothetical protein
LKGQHIEDLKQIVSAVKPSIINNNHHTVVNNINHSKNYTQNNTLLNSRLQVDSLVPVTSQYLNNMVTSSLKKAQLSNKYFQTFDELCESWVDTDLKESLLITDHSRGVAHWKDGDQNNKTIKDPKCTMLAEKLVNSIQPKDLQEYSEYIVAETEASKTDVDKFLKIANTSLLVGVLKSNDKNMLKAIAPGLTKFAKSYLQSINSCEELKKRFVPLVTSIESGYGENITKLITSDAQTIAAVLFVPLLHNPVNALSIIRKRSYMFRLGSQAKTAAEIHISHFFDFVRLCIIETYGVLSKQCLLTIKCTMKSLDPHIDTNFQMFADWLAFDRSKQRAADDPLLFQIDAFENKIFECMKQANEDKVEKIDEVEEVEEVKQQVNEWVMTEDEPEEV